MEFCPECGGIMLPFQVKVIIEDENEKGYSDERYIEQEYLRCNSCGYKKDISDYVRVEYNVGEKVESTDNVIMIENERGMQSTVNEFCPKCGHNRAFCDIKQSKGSAEGPTFFFRCEECGFTWRDQ